MRTCSPKMQKKEKIESRHVRGIRLLEYSCVVDGLGEKNKTNLKFHLVSSLLRKISLSIFFS